MNIENLKLLSEMLQGLGFSKGISSQLLKHACLLPDQFTVTELMMQSGDTLRYDIRFQKTEGSYHLKFYDASLRKELSIPEELEALDDKMSAINWQALFGTDAKGAWKIDDDTSHKIAANIATIIVELEKLESDVAMKLKVKHWGDVSGDSFNISILRSKFEITQRFYFFDDQGCISAADAYRFLQNRWMEKQMLVNRRQELGRQTETSESRETSKMLPKKRRKNAK